MSTTKSSLLRASLGLLTVASFAGLGVSVAEATVAQCWVLVPGDCAAAQGCGCVANASPCGGLQITPYFVDDACAGATSGNHDCGPGTSGTPVNCYDKITCSTSGAPGGCPGNLNARKCLPTANTKVTVTRLPNQAMNPCP